MSKPKRSLHLVHEPDGGRIGYQKICKADDKPVPDDEIVKAFEFRKDELVVVTDEDFAAARTEGVKSIETVSPPLTSAATARPLGISSQVMEPSFVSPSELFGKAPYEYAAIAPAGGLVFAAGACPIDAKGVVVGPGDFEVQARQAADNLAVALEAAGSGFDRVLKTTVFVVAKDGSELIRAWRVVEAAFAPARPASTLLGVSVLGYPGQLVEIEAIALGG